MTTTAQPNGAYARTKQAAEAIGVRVIDTAKLTPDELLSSPPLRDDPRKRDYIICVAIFGPVRLANDISGANRATVHDWRKADPDFAILEKAAESLPQRYLLEAQTIRNTYLALQIDAGPLQKAATQGLSWLSPREYDWLKTIRKHYTLGKEEDQPTGATGQVNVTVHVDNQMVEDEHSRRASARQLLQQFNVNDKYINPDRQMIEGEVVSAD